MKDERPSAHVLGPVVRGKLLPSLQEAFAPHSWKGSPWRNIPSALIMVRAVKDGRARAVRHGEGVRLHVGSGLTSERCVIRGGCARDDVRVRSWPLRHRPPVMCGLRRPLCHCVWRLVGRGRASVGAHVAHPGGRARYEEHGEPHAAEVAADDARLGAVAPLHGGLDGAGVLLVAHERGHEIPEGDVGGRRPSQELELHDEGVACALRLVRPLVDALSHDYLPPRVGARPLARLAGWMTPAGKRLCRVCRQNADALEFPEGSPAALRKVFAALARKRPWASLRSQGGVGWGSVRRQLVGMGRCGRCGVWCACALERVVEVWCAQGRVDSAGRRRSCAGDARCTAVMPVKCAGCFAPWWRCSSVAWRPQCPFVIVSGGGLEGHCSAASVLSTRRLA